MVGNESNIVKPLSQCVLELSSDFYGNLASPFGICKRFIGPFIIYDNVSSIACVLDSTNNCFKKTALVPQALIWSVKNAHLWFSFTRTQIATYS